MSTHPHKTGGPWTSPQREEIIAAAGKLRREITELETRRKAVSRQITKLRQELAVALDNLTREEEALRVRREFFNKVEDHPSYQGQRSEPRL